MDIRYYVLSITCSAMIIFFTLGYPMINTQIHKYACYIMLRQGDYYLIPVVIQVWPINILLQLNLATTFGMFSLFKQNIQKFKMNCQTIGHIKHKRNPLI